MAIVVESYKRREGSKHHKQKQHELYTQALYASESQQESLNVEVNVDEGYTTDQGCYTRKKVT